MHLYYYIGTSRSRSVTNVRVEADLPLKHSRYTRSGASSAQISANMTMRIQPVDERFVHRIVSATLVIGVEEREYP